MLLGLSGTVMAADKGGPTLEDPSSFADAASPWTRIYGSLSAAYGIQNTDVSGFLSSTSVTDGDFAYGGGLGGSFRIPHSQLVVGGECNYSWTSNAGADRVWDCLGKLGILISPTTQVFAAAGVLGLDGPAVPAGLEKGMAFGGGVETFVMPNVSAKIEYLYASLGISPGAGFFDPDLDSGLHVVRAGINIKLNGLVK
jgi:opacity protein-like surface antigen